MSYLLAYSKNLFYFPMSISHILQGERLRNFVEIHGISWNLFGECLVQDRLTYQTIVYYFLTFKNIF